MNLILMLTDIEYSIGIGVVWFSISSFTFLFRDECVCVFWIFLFSSLQRATKWDVVVVFSLSISLSHMSISKWPEPFSFPSWYALFSFTPFMAWIFVAISLCLEKTQTFSRPMFVCVFNARNALPSNSTRFCFCLILYTEFRYCMFVWFKCNRKENSTAFSWVPVWISCLTGHRKGVWQM